MSKVSKKDLFTSSFSSTVKIYVCEFTAGTSLFFILMKDLPKKVFFVAKRSKRMPILLLQHQNRISINGIERSAFTSTITLSPSPLLTAAVFSLLSAKPNFFQILDSVLFDTPKNSDSVHHNVFSVANVFALEYPKKIRKLFRSIFWQNSVQGWGE